MGMIVGKNPLNVSGVSSNYFSNPYITRFGGNTDTFQRQGVNETALNYVVKINPNVTAILNEIGAPAKINRKVLNELLSGHASNTRELVNGIIDNLPKSIREATDVKSVREAAYLHDIGKILIPEKILNKEGKLDAKEEEIMHRHPELSYEILKSLGIHPNTLELVKYHHQNSSHTGYPKVPDEFLADVNLQILSLADRYSALTEVRPYKKAYSKDKALAILYKDVKSGDISPLVFRALVNCVNNKTISKSQSV